MVGEDADLEKIGRILNRVIKWSLDGITIEADQIHVREMLRIVNWNKRIAHRLFVTWLRRMKTMQEVMEPRWRTNVNRDSAKTNKLG